jgi:SHS family lactate transporter-like MFS transporter
MKILAELRALDRQQRAAFYASFLSWTLDAFDFFLLVFVFKAIAGDFHTQVATVAVAALLTLVFRPVGALLFGWLADRYGRHPVLMANVLLFSLLELASAFAPSLHVLFICRALFGIAMGGVWGVGSSLVMESIPPSSRGVVSGILQEGYALGYLLAALVYGLLFQFIGWRGMFIVGVAPALLVFYIASQVKESPTWQKDRHRPARPGLFASLRRNWKLFLYVIVLMTAFNFFSHGTQDFYPTFLQTQRHLSAHWVGALAIVANVGAIIGGVWFGSLSQRIGRRRTIIIAALLALPVIPLWAFATTPLLLGAGAFFIQVAVQGAWGVVPAHLNELSPEEIRGTFPGLAAQLGNLFAASNTLIQPRLAASHGGNYALALALVAGITAVVLVIVTACGKESRESVFGSATT